MTGRIAPLWLRLADEPAFTSEPCSLRRTCHRSRSGQSSGVTERKIKKNGETGSETENTTDSLARRRDALVTPASGDAGCRQEC